MPKPFGKAAMPILAWRLGLPRQSSGTNGIQNLRIFAHLFSTNIAAVQNSL
jgi:hypothetical protein